MRLQHVLKSIAGDISGEGITRFRTDCHGRTARYFREEGGKDTDRIIIFAASEHSVIHSMVVDKDGEIVADIYSDDGKTSINSYDPKTVTIDYQGHGFFKGGLKAFFDMPFSEFKQKHMGKVISFKEYLERNK